MGDKPDVIVPPLQENTDRRPVGNGWVGEERRRGKDRAKVDETTNEYIPFWL